MTTTKKAPAKTPKPTKVAKPAADAPKAAAVDTSDAQPSGDADAAAQATEQADHSHAIVHPIVQLSQAQELPEVEHNAKAVLFESEDPAHICAFKSVDGRTMRVVHVAGGLAAMQAA
jgi:hypothetical protein